MPTSPADRPRVSVVIATHGRAALLAETLAALARQTRAGLEVVVVDDDSPDDTAAVAESWGAHVLRVPRGGPGRARQRGWQVAVGDVIAFTDDDCIPDDGWIEHLVTPIEAGEADLVQGRTLPRSDQLHLIGPWSRTQRIEAEKGFYQTCNMAYRRHVLEAVGGFRPEFAGPLTAGEDTDLAWRAKKAGFRSAFAADAVVHHAVWASSYWEHLRSRRRRAMVVEVIKRHPEVRERVYRRYFFHRSHLRTIVGVAGLATAAAIRPWLPVAAVGSVAVIYLVRTRASDTPAHRRLAHVSKVALANGVEVAVFTWSSVRRRTILL